MTDAWATGIAAVLTLLISSGVNIWQNGKQRTAADDAAKWRARFDAEERRYSDRRDAAVALDAAAEKETGRMYAVHLEGGMGVPDDYTFPKLNDAHARVVLMCTPVVVEAGTELRDAVVHLANDTRSQSWTRYNAALDAFRKSARSMLAADIDKTSS